MLSYFQEVACRKEEEERKAREKQEEEEAKCLEKFQDADPLEQDELHTFTDTMLPGCFHLLDELPDTVYRVCDLIMTAIKRNGADYRDMILKQVVNQVNSQGVEIRECVEQFTAICQNLIPEIPVFLHST